MELALLLPVVLVLLLAVLQVGLLARDVVLVTHAAREAARAAATEPDLQVARARPRCRPAVWSLRGSTSPSRSPASTRAGAWRCR